MASASSVLVAAAPSLIVVAFQIDGGDAMARYAMLAGASLLSSSPSRPW